ncbi:MAG: sporulation protein YqfD [Lawsonibacter sp.]|nr:sporulation protein YqfD [Lawsonibacter sp.]
MKRLINFLLGMVTLTITGPFPERLMNLCAQQGIDFWKLFWVDEHTLRLTTRRRQLPLLRKLAERVHCEVKMEGSRGLPDFLIRFRTRYAFLAGLALSLCAVAILSQFVLTVEVTGNQRVPTAVILTQLRQLGVRPGVYGPSIDRQQVAQEAMLKMEDLAWMGINLHGTRLEVIVRETVQVPERVDETGYYDIVAEADGIITHVEAELGDAAVKQGDTVLTGEVLISGTVTMEPPKYSDLPIRYYQTHARGRVWARTWRKLTAAIPTETWVKSYTGAEKDVWALNVMGRRVSLFGSGVDWPFFDKVTKARQAVLPGNVVLPITLVRENCREYEAKIVEVDREAARTLLEEQLAKRLQALVDEDGQIESTAYSARVEGGLLRVTLQAECREEIGKEVPGSAPLPAEEPEQATAIFP